MATDNGSSGSTARRTRRSPQEVRELLLGAARSTFAARGYARSSTRDIAGTAGVSEALLFRHFGPKANLLGQGVLVPVQGFMNDNVDGRPPALTDHPARPEAPSRD